MSLKAFLLENGWKSPRQGFHRMLDENNYVCSKSTDSPTGLKVGREIICADCLSVDPKRKVIVQEIMKHDVSGRHSHFFYTDPRFSNLGLPTPEKRFIKTGNTTKPEPKSRTDQNMSLERKDRARRKAISQKIQSVTAGTRRLAPRYREHETNIIHKDFLMKSRLPGYIKVTAARLYCAGQKIGQPLSANLSQKISESIQITKMEFEEHLAKSRKLREFSEWPEQALSFLITNLKPMTFTEFEFLVAKVTELRDQLIELDKPKNEASESSGLKGYKEFPWTTDDSGRSK